MIDSLNNPVNILNSPFDLKNDAAYQTWREHKLTTQPAALDDLIVEINDPQHLHKSEQDALLERCRNCNMAIYISRSGQDSNKDLIVGLGQQLGLERLDHNKGADEDAVTSLTVQEDAVHRGYIPYSNRPIAWHTDGYYNRPDRQIHGLLLHCVQPAADGGDNDLMDHEIAYIRLRDLGADYIRALMHPQAMTIPANKRGDVELRPDQPGPVFSVHPDGHLHMRYTDRKRNIIWRDDPLTLEAVDRLKQILHADDPDHYRGKLQAGWGLVCNNVLHTRTGFNDNTAPRLLYRARYYDRIVHT